MAVSTRALWPDCGLGTRQLLNMLSIPPSALPSLRSFRDYYAALLRTHQSFVAPTQGKLLNYVQRVPLGVVAQITVRPLSRGWGILENKASLI